jgi:RNA recognition motif-containing protein
MFQKYNDRERFREDSGDHDRYKNKRKRHDSDQGEESEKFRKLFIGGLSYDTTDDELKEYFEKWGEVVDCIVMKETGTQRYVYCCMIL